MLKFKDAFVLKYDEEKQGFYHVITLYLPVEPYNSLVEKMTENQMETLYQQVAKMLEKLETVEKQTKKAEACEILVGLFGKDFPVTVDKSVVGTSESA